MKTIILVLALCFTICFAKGQSVKPYLAIIKTKSCKYKGILHKINSSDIILNDEGNFIKIQRSDIKTAQIRAIKKNFKSIDLIKIGSDKQVYTQNSNGKMVDQWGKEMPTVEDELATTFFSVIGTAIANGLALPIHAINSNLAKFRFNGDIKSRQLKFEELNYYSIYYQANPNVLAELRKMKEISAPFKP